MNILTRASVAAIAIALSVPSGFAKIYPDDFMIQPWPLGGSSSITETRGEATRASMPLFFASEIPAGQLTRSQFVDAIATRMYDADAHDNCYGDLVLSQNYDYQLLFNDVTLNAQYASSICLAIRSGFMQGERDGRFYPERLVTAAEAAAVLTRVAGLPYRDSNHMRKGEAWYQPYMDAIRSIDREFTLLPRETVTGTRLKHALCVLRSRAPVDPMDEFGGKC